jgi:hypothetical protein
VVGAAVCAGNCPTETKQVKIKAAVAAFTFCNTDLLRNSNINASPLKHKDSGTIKLLFCKYSKKNL